MRRRYSRITYSRPNESKTVSRTVLDSFVYFNDLPIATLRPKGANAGTPLGINGTTTGNPANGATAANANNVGNNSTTNRVNVEIFYVHADHLGTPRVVTRSTVATGANAPSSATPTSPGAINKAVWRHDSDPFGTSLGNSQPTENPQLITGTATQIQAGTFKQNQRLPGQLADGESGKSYNYFRDYDSSVGRYSTSDPIGLGGGINSYTYVKSQPMHLVDPLGLASCEGTWQYQGFNPTLPRVLRRCMCYWLCIPCRGSVAWSGRKEELPSTSGSITFDPKQRGQDAGDVEGGNNCICPRPAESGCEPVCRKPSA